MVAAKEWNTLPACDWKLISESVLTSNAWQLAS
jgi:hypothetical protein